MKYLLCTLISLLILCCTEAKGSNIQYYWATPTTVFLWSSAEDHQPVLAKLDVPNDQWSVQPSESAQQWHNALLSVGRQIDPATDTKQFSDQQLWHQLLQKLRADSNESWATPRKPSIEVYLRKTNSALVHVVFIGPILRTIYFFENSSSGSWEKRQDIPISDLLGVELNSAELRKIFDIPVQELLPNGRAGWATVWNRWIKTCLEGESIRPVMFLDNRNTWQWLWRQRLDPQDELPTSARVMAQPLPLVSKPGTDSSSPTHGVTSKSQVGIIVVVSIIAAVLVFVALVFITRRQVGRAGQWLVKSLQAVKVRPPKKDTASLSRDGLVLLHESVKAKYATESVLQNDALRPLVNFTLDWVYEKYVETLESADFASREKETRSAIIQEYKAALSVSEIADSELIKTLSTGQSAAKALQEVPQLKGLAGVTSSLTSGKLILESDEDWMENWPSVISGLDTLLEDSHRKHQALNEELLKLQSDRQSELARREEELKSLYDDRIKEMEIELAGVKKDRDEVRNDLAKANDKSTNLDASLSNKGRDLQSATSKLTEFQEAIKKFQKIQTDMQEVAGLSNLLRPRVVGLLSQQSRHDNTNSPELRPVGIVMALANFSLLHMCFSIINDNRLLRKGMAHNLLAIGQAVSDDLTQREYLKILYRLEGGVEQALTDLNDRGAYAPDAQLFRTLLTTLRSDVGTDLGRFFVDVDSDQKIVAVS